MERSAYLPKGLDLRRKAQIGLLAIALAAVPPAAVYGIRQATEEPQPRPVPAVDLAKDTCKYEGLTITTQGYLGESAGIVAEQQSILGRFPYKKDFLASHTLYDTATAIRGTLVSHPDEPLTVPPSLSKEKDSSITYVPPLNPDGQKKQRVDVTGIVEEVVKGTCYVRATEIEQRP